LDGVVIVEHDMNLKRQHQLLQEMDVRHEYAAPVDQSETGPKPSIIRMNLDDALKHLPHLFTKAREEISRKLRGDQAEQQR